MKCGIDLIIWTGARGTLPEQHFIRARRYSDGEIKICNYGSCPGPQYERKTMSVLNNIQLGTHQYGLTTVTRREPTEDEILIAIDHAGNMGNTVKDVDNNLFALCDVRIAELVSDPMHIGGEEWGSPDYLYQYLMRFSRKKGVPLRSSYFTTPIALGDTPRSVRKAWGRPWHMQKEGCCLYYYWGSLERPHSVVKFIDGSAESIWSDATRGLITRVRGD